jgi:hypothetical protein
MSAVCILAPVVIASWPAFTAAIMAAAASLGYQVVSEGAALGEVAQVKGETQVSLEIPQSQVVTETLGRQQTRCVTRDGVTVTFARDARGKATLCVTGTNQTDDTLRALGEELSNTVVQQYVYQKLLDEMRAKGFVVVQEETEADRSIHLKIRHWQG